MAFVAIVGMLRKLSKQSKLFPQLVKSLTIDIPTYCMPYGKKNHTQLLMI